MFLFDEKYSQQNILVIGGAGFIGSNLVRELVDIGAKVSVIDFLVPNYGGNLFNLDGYEGKIEFVQADICDLDLAKQLVIDKAYIFNLAGQTSHLDSMQDPFTDQKNNVTARLNVLEACRQVNPDARIVYTSTRQIYGRPLYLPVDESHPLSPVDFNGVSEIASEHYHNLYHSIFHLKITILRLTNVYGPRMRIKDARQNFIGKWIRQIMEGEEILVFGDGSQLRDLLFVSDVTEALLRTGISQHAIGEVLNLGTAPISLLDLAHQMVEIAGKGSYRVTPFPVERKAIDIGSYYGNYSKATRLLSWEPKIHLSKGLLNTFEYYIANFWRYI
jgi:UDP-glucose 4-epimerase